MSIARHFFSTSHRKSTQTASSYNESINQSSNNNNSTSNDINSNDNTHQSSLSRPRASTTTLSSLTKILPKVSFPLLPHHLPHLRRHSHTTTAVDDKHESHNYDRFSPLHSSNPHTNTTDTMSMSPVDTPTTGQNYDDLSPSQSSPPPVSPVTQALLASPRSSPKASLIDNTHIIILNQNPIDKKSDTTHTLHIPSSPPAANTDLNEPNSDHTSCSSLFTIFNPLLLLCTPCHTATATITTPLPTNDDEAMNDVLVENDSTANIGCNMEEDGYNSSFMKCVYYILHLYCIHICYIV